MSDSTVVPASTLIQNIPVDQINPSSHQARKNFDEEGLKGLAESMKEEGLLQAITVRKMGGAYELVAGERRLRAAKLLDWATIEAKVIQPISEAESAAKGLVENLQREDLNPIEEAEGFSEIGKLDPSYWNQTKIGEVSGRTQTYISRSLALLGLPDIIVQNMRARIFSRSHGLEFLRLNTPEDQLNAAKEVLDKKLSWEATRKLVDSMLAKPASKAEQAGDQVLGPFKFTQKGQNITMAATFPATGDLDKFLADLRTAYLTWSSKATVTAETAATSESAVKAASPRLPNSPEEMAELEAISATSGPKGVYDRIYGPDSPVTQAVTFSTWEEVGTTPSEGLHLLLEGIRQLQAGGR